ncbi:MAG TPA: NUDIX domain-containing protein, partial [Gammaproteobacteria bacterium]|nr:NUDIX domain-containing protein [Gammaproteobacteria bacterium]
MTSKPAREECPLPVPKRPISVLVVVHTRSGEVLLLERIQPPGWWQSVTGSLEAGETPWDAAVRELHEETGMA